MTTTKHKYPAGHEPDCPHYSRNRESCPHCGSLVDDVDDLDPCTCQDTAPTDAEITDIDSAVSWAKKHCINRHEQGLSNDPNAYSLLWVQVWHYVYAAYRAKSEELAQITEEVEYEKRLTEELIAEMQSEINAEKQRADRLAEYCRSIQKPLGEIECAFHNRIRSERAFEKFGNMVDQIRCGLAELLEDG